MTAPDIGSELKELIEQIAGFRRQVRNRLIAQGVLLIVVVLVLILGVLTVVRITSQNHCISHWANATSARSNATAQLAAQRVDLLYSYLRTAAEGSKLTPTQRQALVKHLESLRDQFPKIIPPPSRIAKTPDTILSAYNYLVMGFQTNDRYAVALRQNPLPKSPSEACNYLI